MSIAVGVGLAQNTPPNPAPQDTPQSKPATQPQTNAQSDIKTGAPSGSTKATPAEMKTATFKGVLVDMACSSGKSVSAEATPAQQPDASKAPASDQSNTADRSAGGGASCPVSANSSELGMRLDDGKTVRFDLVGNQRAQEALKNDKRLSKDIGANKPVHVKVNGVLNGDKLIVTTIQ
ncbi:MAG TPA: hypothetical protein VKR61_05475 [Bryobacteraceae bacterium]|nr:hypothetical protein [Bryobacteraceae bacterium]